MKHLVTLTKPIPQHANIFAGFLIILLDLIDAAINCDAPRGSTCLGWIPGLQDSLRDKMGN